MSVRTKKWSYAHACLVIIAAIPVIDAAPVTRAGLVDVGMKVRANYLRMPALSSSRIL